VTVKQTVQCYFDGVDCKYVSLHSSTVLDVQESIVTVIDHQMIETRRKRNFFGLLIDESTDIGLHKTMVMYLRYVTHGEMVTDFVGTISLF